ncbi:MAG: FHA domain-containing protein, partial [Myxococcota bacterium]|nr:FHA domain-containing protein [Myxococcota bacterium]
MPRIVYLDPSNQEMTVELSPASPVVSIGRLPDNTIRLQSQSISRHHAKITLEGGRIVLQDLGSSNGSYINGKRVEKQELHVGDKFRCGDYPLELRDDERAVSLPPPVRQASHSTQSAVPPPGQGGFPPPPGQGGFPPPPGQGGFPPPPGQGAARSVPGAFPPPPGQGGFPPPPGQGGFPPPP